MDTPHISKNSGFTVIELVVVAVIFALAGALIFIQINNIKIANQDNTRKTAINAMHYALEEVYYKKNLSYPASLSSATLPSVDPVMFTDPDGFTLGKDALSEDELKKLIESGDTSPDVEQRLAALSANKSPNYHYEATNCDTDNKCKGYSLTANLIGESQYVKKNRSH